MTTQHGTDEAAIRQQIDKLVEALRATDLAAVKSIYAPDMVSFDVGPPLQVVGVEAKAKNWIEVFAAFQHPIDYEIRGLSITVDGDLAVAHSINRLNGTLKNGEQERLLGSRDVLLAEDRWRVARRARPRLGAAGRGDRSRSGRSRALTS